MLNSGQAWCLFCLQASSFEKVNRATATPCGTFAVRTGQCAQCGENMVRVFPNDGRQIPEAQWRPGSDWSVIDVPTLFSQVTDSTDVRGQTAVLPDGTGGTAKWLAIARVKAAAGHFDAILGTLIREGQAMPVAMWEEKGDGYWTIGNGHHRLIAMLLLGMTEVMVVISYNRDAHRMADTADENWPITPQGTRYVWELIRDVLPGDVVPASDAPRYACAEQGLSQCVCHCDCELGSTQDSGSQSHTEALREDALIAARGAAANAVWALAEGVRAQLLDAKAQREALIDKLNALDKQIDALTIQGGALMMAYQDAVKIG